MLIAGHIITAVQSLVSRNIARTLGNKISGRTKLSPAAMEATHDLDFVLWCLQPAKPVKVYSTGMFVRLAFAAAINVNPDVLLVGDSLTIQWGPSWPRHFPGLKSVNIGVGGRAAIDVGSIPQQLNFLTVRSGEPTSDQ